MAKQIKAKLTADTTDFERKMLRAKKVTGQVGKAMSVGLVAGAAAAAAGIFALNRVMSEAVGLANVQEAAETKLTAVLKATGEAAGYNSEQLKEMAGELQKVTTFGDETTLSGMAILATFKQVRGEGFERATKAAMDMSSVMGTNLNSSILQIGKALNDPIKGLSMLTRVGVTFTDQQKDQIKALQKSGDLYGAQSIILKELETQFGGTSEALRNTFAGAVTAAENALGDLKEELGFVITKNEFFIEAAKLAEQAFVGWTKELGSNQDQMHALSKEIAIGLVGAIGGALETMRFFHNAWLGIKLVGTVAIDAVAQSIAFLYGGMRLLLKPMDLLFIGLKKLGAIDVNPFDGVEEALGTFATSSREVTNDVISDIKSTNAAYDKVIGKVKGFQTSLKKIEVQHTATAAAGKKSGEIQEKAIEGSANAAEKSFKARQAQIDAHILKLNALQDAKGTATDYWIIKDQLTLESTEGTIKKQEEATNKFTTFSKNSTNELTNAFIRGEDMKMTVAGMAANYMGDLAARLATEGLAEILGRKGAEIGANVGLGAAQTSTEGTTWQQKLGSAAAYLAGAGAAVFAGKAIGDSFAAEGGWIGSNPGGGMLRGGSGTRDDLFLGFTDGGSTRNWGMGGEFVVNKESTSRFLPLLESINSKNFAEGGPVTDPWGPTRGINDSGFDTFWMSLLESKGNWYKAIADSVAYYGGTGVSMLGGKAVGKNLFAAGGQVQDRGFLFGGFLDKLFDPFGIQDKFNPMNPFGVFDSQLGQYLDPASAMPFEKLWQLLRKMPIVGESVEHADNILYPFVRDVITPGGNPSFGTVKDMLKGMFEGIEKEGKALLTGGFSSGFDLFGIFHDGTDYVPQSGSYLLKQGERVEPVGGSSTKALVEEVKKLRAELSSISLAVAGNTLSTSKMLAKWDRIGMPAVQT